MRIIAGQYKGRALLTPKGCGTRPMSSVVKKSLFDMLLGVLPAATVLDLYCGTGTLGLEALSRGARRCFFAERDGEALDGLARNIEALGAAESCVVWRGDVERRLASWLRLVDGCVELAFVDPPYALVERWSWPAAVERIFDPLAAGLAAGGLVVLRSSARAAVPDTLGGLAVERKRRYGDMAVTMFRRRAAGRSPQERQPPQARFS